VFDHFVAIRLTAERRPRLSGRGEAVGNGLDFRRCPAPVPAAQLRGVASFDDRGFVRRSRQSSISATSVMLPGHFLERELGPCCLNQLGTAAARLWCSLRVITRASFHSSRPLALRSEQYEPPPGRRLETRSPGAVATWLSAWTWTRVAGMKLLQRAISALGAWREVPAPLRPPEAVNQRSSRSQALAPSWAFLRLAVLEVKA